MSVNRLPGIPSHLYYVHYVPDEIVHKRAQQGVQVISGNLVASLLYIFTSLMWSRDRATQEGSEQIRVLREAAGRCEFSGRQRADMRTQEAASRYVFSGRLRADWRTQGGCEQISGMREEASRLGQSRGGDEQIMCSGAICANWWNQGANSSDSQL